MQESGVQDRGRQYALCGHEDQTSQVSPVEEGLLREVHHRVKNNLQVVCSLLRIQGREITDASLREVLKRSEERIQTMALVYDNLCRGDGYDLVPLHKYLQDMSKHLVSGIRRESEPVRLAFELQSAYVSSQVATSIGLLMNELISSLLRQDAIQPRRSLGIRLMNDGTTAHVEIHEVGEPPRPLGTRSQVAQQVLDALVLQVRGRIEYANEGGVVVRLSFPLKRDSLKMSEHHHDNALG